MFSYMGNIFRTSLRGEMRREPQQSQRGKDNKMQTKSQASTDKILDLESCLCQIFIILKLKHFRMTAQLQWVSLFPISPAFTQKFRGNSEFVASTAAQCTPWELPRTSRNGNGLGAPWAVRAMGLVSKNPKGTHKKQLPCKRAQLPWAWTGWTTSDQQLLFPFFFHHCSVCFKAQRPQNPPSLPSSQVQ